MPGDQEHIEELEQMQANHDLLVNLALKEEAFKEQAHNELLKRFNKLWEEFKMDKKPMADSIHQTLEDREKEYGDYAKKARLIQDLLNTINKPHHNVRLHDPAHMETIHMIFHKLARVLIGNEDNPDHWHDIAGYAMLSERIALQYAEKNKED